MKSKAKFHISLGHETVLAKLTLLHGGEVSSSSAKDTFDFSPEYHYQVKLEEEKSDFCHQNCKHRSLLRMGERQCMGVNMSCWSWSDASLSFLELYSLDQGLLLKLRQELFT